MRRIYSFLYALAFWPRLLLGAVTLGRSGERSDVFAQRLGKFPSKLKQALTNRNRIWLHASSKEAIQLSTQVIAALERRTSLLKVVCSTSTSTGMSRLSELLPYRVERIYLPFDLWRSVQRAINVIHPEAFVMLDLEVRPNLLRRFRHRRIPTFLFQSQPGLALKRRYRLFAKLYRPLFAWLKGVAVPNQASASALRAVGCRSEAIELVGPWPRGALSLRERRPLDVCDLFRRVGFQSNSPILLGTRTHAGEEAILADVFLRLRKQYPDLHLALAPADYRRGKSVARELKTRGIRYAYRTAISTSVCHEPGKIDCLLINTRDELPQFEEHATLIFLGKSLSGTGGSSPVEPGALGKPLLFGPHMEEFKSVARSLVEEGGGLEVQDAAGLEAATARLLEQPAAARAMGQKARAIARARLESVDQAVDLVLRHCDPTLL